MATQPQPAPKGFTSLEILLFTGMFCMLVIGSWQLYKGGQDRAQREANEAITASMTTRSEL